MNFEVLSGIIMKKYILAIFAALFGALAHSLQEVQKSGWKSWISFISDMVICSFVGYSFYHLSLLIYPNAQFVFTSIGAYWGTNGYIILKKWVITSIKSNIK